ncbi:MAG: hypothetical protein ACREQ9_06840 [Candidatus Binatia bacterium]
MSVLQNGATLASVGVVDFVGEIAQTLDWSPTCGILPSGVRLWQERGDVVALLVEVPPHARTVPWLEGDSPADFGRGAKYRHRYLAFPYVELLFLLRQGALTGHAQLYYRNDSLDSGEDLLLPNLPNVSSAYGLTAWLCLANLHDVSRLSWPEKVRAVVEHVYLAAWNRSSERHEGSSLWGAPPVDPRLASVEAWEEATRKDPKFVLEVPWRSARTTARAEISCMLDAVIRAPSLTTATDLAGIVTRASGAGSAQGGRRSWISRLW